MRLLRRRRGAFGSAGTGTSAGVFSCERRSGRCPRRVWSGLAAGRRAGARATQQAAAANYTVVSRCHRPSSLVIIITHVVLSVCACPLLLYRLTADATSPADLLQHYLHFTVKQNNNKKSKPSVTCAKSAKRVVKDCLRI